MDSSSKSNAKLSSVRKMRSGDVEVKIDRSEDDVGGKWSEEL